MHTPLDAPITTNPIRRRRLLAGAAWATPAIAVVAPAPAMAASCPASINGFTQENWTVTTTGTPSSGGYYWKLPSYFLVNGDPSTSATYTVTICQNMAVTAGYKYTLTVTYYLRTLNPVPITGTLTVNGTNSSPGGTPQVDTSVYLGSDQDMTTHTFTMTHTATTTGNVPVCLKTSITGTATETTGDDISWRGITVACSKV